MIVGSAVFTGGCTGTVTTEVAADVAWPVPAELIAVTATSTVLPASPDANLYELPVAPEMLEQFVPEPLQSCH